MVNRTRHGKRRTTVGRVAGGLTLGNIGESRTLAEFSQARNVSAVNAALERVAVETAARATAKAEAAKLLEAAIGRACALQKLQNDLPGEAVRDAARNILRDFELASDLLGALPLARFRLGLLSQQRVVPQHKIAAAWVGQAEPDDNDDHLETAVRAIRRLEAYSRDPKNVKSAAFPKSITRLLRSNRFAVAFVARLAAHSPRRT